MRFIPPWQIDQSKFPKKVRQKNMFFRFQRIQVQGTERKHKYQLSEHLPKAV